jgi:hypothetical protein
MIIDRYTTPVGFDLPAFVKSLYVGDKKFNRLIFMTTDDQSAMVCNVMVVFSGQTMERHQASVVGGTKTTSHNETDDYGMAA